MQTIGVNPDDRLWVYIHICIIFDSIYTYTHRDHTCTYAANVNTVPSFCAGSGASLRRRRARAERMAQEEQLEHGADVCRRRRKQAAGQPRVHCHVESDR